MAAPELMQDTFMSDSEDEGGELYLSNYLLFSLDKLEHGVMSKWNDKRVA